MAMVKLFLVGGGWSSLARRFSTCIANIRHPGTCVSLSLGLVVREDLLYISCVFLF